MKLDLIGRGLTGADRHIGDTEAAARLFAPELGDQAIERLCVAHLDRALRLLKLAVVRYGGARSVVLPLRGTMRDALKLGTRAIIVAHNHPGGDPTPSRADRIATRRLAEIARALDIRLLDHLIFAGDDVVSFRELGLL